MLHWDNMGCRDYRARLETYATSTGPHRDSDRALEAHLHLCSRCRIALDNALLAGTLMHRAEKSGARSSEPLVTRVMATIREEIARRNVPETIWRPLEHLASRFALGAAAALLLFSVYLATYTPAFRPATGMARAEAGAIMPEPPAAPATADEVMMSLVERAPQ